MSSFRIAVLAAAAMVLAACGFQPVYRSGPGTEVLSEFTAIQIAPIEDRVGQVLRNHLLNSINPYGRSRKTQYRLEVVLSEGKQELAVRKSEIATRANLNLSATFRLIPVDDENGSAFGGSTTTVASYNILSSDFATLASENDARERAARAVAEDITQRLAAHFRAQRTAGLR